MINANPLNAYLAYTDQATVLAGRGQVVQPKSKGGFRGVKDVTYHTAEQRKWVGMSSHIRTELFPHEEFRTELFPIGARCLQGGVALIRRTWRILPRMRGWTTNQSQSILSSCGTSSGE